MIAALEFCICRRSDGVELGCWPWWATGLPVAAVVLLVYLVARSVP